MFERFTEKSRQAVAAAQDFARDDGHTEITAWDLLVGLRQSQGAANEILSVFWPDPTVLEGAVRNLWAMEHVAAPHLGVAQLPFSAVTKNVLEKSVAQALQRGISFVGTEHILLSLCEHCEGYALIPDLSRVRQAIDGGGLLGFRTEKEVRAAMELPELEAAQEKARYEVIRIAAPEFIVVIDGVVQGDPGRPFIFYDEQHAHESGRKWTS